MTRYTVTEADTAIALGSGDVPVLATPRLIAWMEAATVQAANGLHAADETTVGIAVRIEHRRATPVGAGVTVTATAPGDAQARRLTFTVLATDDTGRSIATGEIDRAILDRRKFLAAVHGF